MMFHLPAIIRELQRHYHVQLYGDCNICISGIRLCKERTNEPQYTPNQLNIIRLRSLVQLAEAPADTPILCVVHPDNLAVTVNSYFGQNTLIIVFAEEQDDVLLVISEALYACGQANSNLEELSKELLKCRTPEAATALGYQWLHTPLVLADRHQNVIACAGSRKTSLPHNETIWTFFELPQEQGQNTAMLRAMDESAGSRWPVMVHNNVTAPSILCKTLCSGTQIDGYLLLHYHERTYREGDMEILELLGNVCAILLRDRISRQDRHENAPDFLGELLYHLIDDIAYTRDQMERYMDSTGYQPKPMRYILSVFPTDQTPNQLRPVHGLLEHLVGCVPDCTGTYFMNNMTLLIETDSETVDFSAAWPKLEQALRENGLMAGVSNVCRDIMALKDAYFQAQRAVALGPVVLPEEIFKPYYRCAPYHLLELGASYQSPLDFCDPNLLKLQRMDAENNTDLLHTLWVYLETGRNKAQTAKRLFLHINTVSYRLNQIDHIVNLHSTSLDDEFRMYLSMLLLRYASNNGGAKRQQEPVARPLQFSKDRL